VTVVCNYVSLYRVILNCKVIYPCFCIPRPLVCLLVGKEMEKQQGSVHHGMKLPDHRCMGTT
jgi:hypothetical protein